LIYSLIADFGIDKEKAENMSEYDYTFLTAIKNQQSKIEKYLMDSKSGN